MKNLVVQPFHLDRRVYTREMKVLLGCGSTWLRHLEKKGVIPQGRRDPGGKRKWWTASEANAIVESIPNTPSEAAR